MPCFCRNLGLLLALSAGCAPAADLYPNAKVALSHISADSLRGHLSFLSSDLLEGRGTPSRGLDLAAEYIAAQFRRAGLEPAGDDNYFQTARYRALQIVTEGLRFEASGQPPIDPSKIGIFEIASGISLDGAPAVKLGDTKDLAGKVVFIHAATFREAAGARRRAAESNPALVVITGVNATFRARRPLIPEDARVSVQPTITIADDALAKQIEAAPAGPLPFSVTVHIPAPKQESVVLRNVAAVLRGSDPALANTYELVTSHYDHLGLKPEGGGDRIYNGANDDASGTVSVIEIASALASVNPRPRRSIVFVAFFGEEMGLLGSRYYGAHPLFPLASTVADVNLEHMGRTDSDGGPHAGMVNFTGFDFSTVPATFRKAGVETGVEVVKDEKNSDLYFSRSDNQAMADIGVPAHTISVGYEFPDYHKVGDEWQKIDYENMAHVDRMIALGLLMIAGDPAPPHWNEDNSKAAKYVEAWRKLR